jgi:hypothetical protein
MIAPKMAVNDPMTSYLSGFFLSTRIPHIIADRSEHPMSTSRTTTSSSSSADHSALTHISQLKSLISFYTSAIYGNKKVFMPRWRPENALTDPEYFVPYEWTYLYDHSPLVNTLEKYIDYNKLQPNGRPNARLIITAVNVLTSDLRTLKKP